MTVVPWDNPGLAANGEAIKDNFAAWFGNSKIVGIDGHPMVVYHGTSVGFSCFQKPDINRMADRSAVGFWFTSDRADAEGYGTKLVQAYISIQKPRRITRRKLDELAVSYPLPEVLKKLKSNGHDGLIIEAIKPDRALGEPGMPEQYVAFSADQIKSAIDNSGLYLKKSSDLYDTHVALQLELARSAAKSVRSTRRRKEMMP